MSSWTTLRPLPELTLHLAATERGLCRLALRLNTREFLKDLKEHLPEYNWKQDADHPALREAARQLDEYFAGELRRFRLPLDLHGTEFQRKVWKTLPKIPYGRTWSYMDVAKAVDSPGAYRAVGQANGANPVAIIVPCHRVISADGSLGGYSCGLDYKRMLLNLEAAVRSRDAGLAITMGTRTRGSGKRRSVLQ